MNPAESRRPAQIAFLAGVLYFAEGLPYGLISELFPLYLRLSGASLTEIGLLSVVSLAWTLKFFWSPLVDRWGTYRRWIAATLAATALTLGLFAVLRPTGGPAFWLVISALALVSATQDIAIDAYTITLTPARLLGPVNSVRVTTYRIAIIMAGGGLAALATISGWPVAFASAAIVTALILLVALRMPELPRAEHGERVAVITGLRRWLARPHAGALLGLVLLYRLGDAALMPMLKPFWVDHGFSAAEIGAITTGVGMTFTILGAWIGGYVVARFGLWKALLWLGIIQMTSNGGYALIASLGAGRPGFYAAAVVENFSGGLGTAAFLAFLMAICDRRFAATEYALLSALFVLTRSVAGAASGVSTEMLGYATFFWITLALGVPGLLLLPSIPRRFE